MAIALATIGVAFAAFCVWLTVRIVNRRERWAKWTLAAVLCVALVAYPLSTGPMEWMHENDSFTDQEVEVLTRFYSPLAWLTANGPHQINDAFAWYLNWCVEALDKLSEDPSAE
jgi:glucan phosphoethanolaminetransferase (alkaline phosphatase superfamily)